MQHIISTVQMVLLSFALFWLVYVINLFISFIVASLDLGHSYAKYDGYMNQYTFYDWAVPVK